MPLAFETRSHGTLAVGFFNVESDMVLVGRYFLFASDLCAWLTSWADEATDAFAEERPVYSIRDPALLGNLHGAIQGWDLSGFIGAVYRRFPFPDKREDFRQQTRGYETREFMMQLIEQYAHPESVRLAAEPEEECFYFGEYVFSRASWASVMEYLWAGGMPRWEDAGPPDYVGRMHQAARNSRHWLFRGVFRS